MTDVSHQRNVQLRKRGDLVVVPVDRDTLDLTYVVKDPVSLRYFRLRPDEYFVLDQLDGKTSLEEIRNAYRAEFRPNQVSFSDVESLLYRFHQLGLVLAESEGQGETLIDRGVEEVRQEWLGKFANFLFIRFPGIDPDPILNTFYPFVRWLFSPIAVMGSLFLMAWALLLVMMNFSQLRVDLPSLEEIFSTQNIVAMMAVLSFTKIAHELGHGFACKHFGGECHEIGPMLLVMTPAMYCDTSDSWLLPNRWQRAAVGAAGMYSELLLATIAAFVWWTTEPGLLHFLSVRVMMVCSISTLLFNANPLLRYDGYYILSDLSRVPNLSQEASEYSLGLLKRYALGMDEPAKPLAANRLFLGTYAALSTVYRWFVVLSILFFVSKFLEQTQLRQLGSALTACAIGGMLVMPTKNAYKFLESPSKRSQIKRGRLMISVMLASIFTVVVLFTPLPHRVFGDAELTTEDRATVYATSPGFVEETLVKPGEAVSKGDVLIRLRNEDLEQRASSLDLLRTQHQLTVEYLEKAQIQNPQIASQIPAAKSALEDARKQYKRAQDRLDTLEIKAHEDGQFIAPTVRPTRASTRGLSVWSGFPTDKENAGAWIESGTQLGAIHQSDAPLAELILQQSDIAFVKVGQPVKCWIRGYEDRLYTGTIVEVSKQDVEAVPDRMAANSGGSVALDPTKQEATPMFASYFARVQLDEDAVVLPGTRGYGRIDVGRQSLAQKLLRRISTLFRIM